MTRTKEEITRELKKTHYHDENKPIARGIIKVLNGELLDRGYKMAQQWLDGEIDTLFEEDTNG